MTASTLTSQPVAAVVRQRVRPSREQLRVAAAMFRAAPEEVTSVVVPVVVPVASDADGRPVERRPEHPGGYWLADRSTPDGPYSFRSARLAAEAVAESHLRSQGRDGVAGWVSIRPDGTWTGFDGFMAEVR